MIQTDLMAHCHVPEAVSCWPGYLRLKWMSSPSCGWQWQPHSHLEAVGPLLIPYTQQGCTAMLAQRPQPWRAWWGPFSPQTLAPSHLYRWWGDYSERSLQKTSALWIQDISLMRTLSAVLNRLSCAQIYLRNRDTSQTLYRTARRVPMVSYTNFIRFISDPTMAARIDLGSTLASWSQ